MQYYEFDCGCKFPVIGKSLTPGGMPLLEFDVENPREDCPAAWALLGRGETKGVFQLESNLGKHWSKRLKPETLEHFGALVAILRPGALNVLDEEGVSTTEHYCRRKNHEEESSSIHPLLDTILSSTYSLIVFQEQSMRIGAELAGFDLKQVDMLRKAIGKKDVRALEEVHKQFTAGVAATKVVSEEIGEKVWSWIKESGRYSFNKSHAISYGITGYQTAYVKAHFPVAFFFSWLRFAHDKPDAHLEANELVNDAKLFGIEVYTPDLRSLHPHAHPFGKGAAFGICDIKGIGESQLGKLKAAVAAAEQKLGLTTDCFQWLDFLFHVTPLVSSTVCKALIQVGALCWFQLPRKLMLDEYQAWSELTDTEKNWIADRKFLSLLDALKALAMPKADVITKTRIPKKGKELEVECLDAALAELKDEREIEENRRLFQLATKTATNKVEVDNKGGCANEARRAAVLSLAKLLENPPSQTLDTPAWIAWTEKELLGVAITCSKVDGCNLEQVNSNCKEVISGRSGFIILGVEVTQVREVKTKKGKNPGAKMAFLSLSDQSAALQDVVVFPDVWAEAKGLLTEGNTVIVQIERGQKKTDADTVIVKQVWQAN